MSSLSVGRRRVLQTLSLLVALIGTACADGHLMVTDQLEARRLATDLRAEFNHANEAANRAVMADTEEASKAAAQEAATATQAVDTTLGQLAPILAALTFSSEQEVVQGFAERFGEFKALDAEILSLAVENTNVKAQRLAWTDGHQAANDLRSSLLGAVKGLPLTSPAVSQARTAEIAVLEIQVLEPRHIAEADEQGMARMEAEMADHERRARSALTALRRAVPARNAASVAAATTALDRFMQVHAQIVQLSRRNSNVRSMALTLGRKRVVAAECADRLRQLEDALSQHQFKATR